MPLSTQPNNQLSLTLDGTEVNCQVIDLSFTMPGTGTGETVEVACPDEYAYEPGTRSDGSISGTVYTDLADTGLTWLLAQAKDTDATIAYVLTFHPDAGATGGIVFTGDAKVNTWSLDFSKPSLSKHSLDLTAMTAVISRPAP